MTRIRMKTEHVEEIIHDMDWVTLQMSVKPGKLRTLAGTLTSAWQGGGAGRYAQRLRQISTRMQHTNTDLQRLGSQTSAEVNQWLGMDQSFWKGLGGLPGVKIRDPRFDMRAYLPWLPSVAPYLIAGPVLGTLIANPPPALFGGGNMKTSVFVGNRGYLVDPYKDPKELARADVKLGELTWKDADGRKDFNGGSAYGYAKVGTLQGGARFGVNENGDFMAGVYAHAALAETSGTAVLGSALFGFTATTHLSAGTADAFAGFKDGSVGANVGVSAAAADLNLGLNVAGANVGVEAGLSAGVEFGFKFGKETKVKFGPFRVGFTFGAAK